MGIHIDKLLFEYNTGTNYKAQMHVETYLRSQNGGVPPEKHSVSNGQTEYLTNTGEKIVVSYDTKGDLIVDKYSPTLNAENFGKSSYDPTPSVSFETNPEISTNISASAYSNSYEHLKIDHVTGDGWKVNVDADLGKLSVGGEVSLKGANVSSEASIAEIEIGGSKISAPSCVFNEKEELAGCYSDEKGFAVNAGLSADAKIGSDGFALGPLGASVKNESTEITFSKDLFKNDEVEMHKDAYKKHY